jgi:hypothetical protein
MTAKGRAAAHEVAVVAPSGVVVLQPALELGVEVGQASEVLTVEGRPVELLEGGALEALADRVVVGRPGWDPVVTDAKLLEMAGEPMTGELGPIIGQHPGKLGADAGQPLGEVVDKAAVSRADLSPATNSPMA